ncbi:MAG: leucyl/phenylalanyl-tRNA--protein transferase [Gammaproteobacteria bacterium]
MADKPVDFVWLDSNDPPDSFPEPNRADPNGLLAVGGDLSPARLLAAYRKGIFPWFNPGERVQWWSPDPRTVIYPRHLHISRSLRKTMRRDDYTVSANQSFADVIDYCANVRHETGTWITQEMADAYKNLHSLGHAHSIEAWSDDKLIGGVYGVCIGAVFFGESMFSIAKNASKVCLVYLTELMQSSGGAVLDCQLPSEHLASMGATDLPRHRFIEELEKNIDQPDFMSGAVHPARSTASLRSVTDGGPDTA